MRKEYFTRNIPPYYNAANRERKILPRFLRNHKSSGCKDCQIVELRFIERNASRGEIWLSRRAIGLTLEEKFH